MDNVAGRKLRDQARKPSEAATQGVPSGSPVPTQPRSAAGFVYSYAKAACESQPLDFWVWISVLWHAVLKKHWKAFSVAKPGVKASHRSLQMSALF